MGHIPAQIGIPRMSEVGQSPREPGAANMGVGVGGRAGMCQRAVTGDTCQKQIWGQPEDKLGSHPAPRLIILPKWTLLLFSNSCFTFERGAVKQCAWQKSRRPGLFNSTQQGHKSGSLQGAASGWDIYGPPLEIQLVDSFCFISRPAHVEPRHPYC